MAYGLKKADILIDQIYNRSPIKAEMKASIGHVKIIDDLTDLLPSSDIYIVAVSDDAIPSVVDQLRLYLPQTSIICHTSGSVSIDVFAPYFKDYGAIWPLQSFSITDNIDWTSLPIVVSGSSERTGDKLQALSKYLTDSTHRYSDQQRQTTHLSAVMANNFTNALIVEANNYLNNHNIDPIILNPLLIKTVEKLKTMSASEAQTGPAVRGDIKTIEKHLALLNDQPELKALYRLMSNLINKDLKL